MNVATIIHGAGRLPIVGSALRRVARLYREGSVVTIQAGHLAGCRWRRSHEYVNGYWLGIYEMPIQECLVRELKPGNVFYDIGANAGFFSVLAARQVGEKGRVYACEPLPENADTIQSQFDLNGLFQCTLVRAAVSEREGKVAFARGADTSTAHMAGGEGNQGASFEVESITIDAFAERNARPDFVKIDVEGAELLVLRGATGVLLRGCRPLFLIEFHGDDLARECMAFLRTYGYRILGLGREPVGETNLPHHVLAVPAKSA
jgi:FkbM family methyltransferase